MNDFAKLMLASIVVMVLHVQNLFAANVTYNLKTHVDGRTITETVSLAAGDGLQDNMPLRFWRAYTTYKYYSDEQLTQEITTAPAEDATVYVDYVFEPPFALSDDEITVWYMLRAFYANNHPYYYYATGNNIKAIINDLGIHTDEGKWAYYGDGFCLNLKNKVAANPWLGVNSSNTSTTMLAQPMEPGFQLFLSTYEKDHIQQFVLGLPQPNDNITVNTKVLGLHDMSSETYIVTPHDLDNSAYWDSHAVLNYSKDKITWCLFFGTIAKDAQNVWHVEYRVSHDYNNVVDRYFYDKDVVERPVDFYFVDKKNYATYEYFHDEEMTQPWDPADANDMIPTMPNTIVWVMETMPQKEHYVTDHWITMVLPYDVDNLTEFFGTASDGVTPAVRVLEYDQLTIEQYPRYVLHFKAVDAMEANKPYLFKADEILADKYLPLAMGPTAETTGNESDLITLSFNDGASTRPDACISMKGTYDGMQLAPTTMEPDENGEVDYIYLYFGYNAKYDPNSSSYVGEEAADGKSPYNFYRVKKTVDIPQNRCYFKLYSTDDANVGFMTMGFDDNEGTSGITVLPARHDAQNRQQGIFHISGMRMDGARTENLPKGIYIVNGEKVIIK